MPDLFVDYIEFRLGLLNCDVRLKSSNDGERVAPAVGFRGDRKRCQHIDARAGGKYGTEVERSRQDPDYSRHFVVQRDGSADDTWIGPETPLP